MSNTEKTIEELEAEVMAELEEGMHDAPTKGAVAAEPMKKVKNGEMQDTGKAVVSPTQGDAPAKKVAGAAKEIGGDAAQKGEGAPEKMKKLNAMAHGDKNEMAHGKKKKNGNGMEEGYTDEEIRALCHSKDHDCATVVEHPVWGKGKPVHGSHAIPDDEGFVEWYDVQFKHGIEEKVMAEDMEIMVSEAHHEEDEMEDAKKMTKEKLHAAMNGMLNKKMTKPQMMAMYAAMHKMGMHDDEEEDDDMNENVRRKMGSIDVSQHVQALMSGEGLSEDFKKKAATIFESAIKTKIRTEVERIDEEYQDELKESIEQTKVELSEKVDTYLNYVVEEWMKENELAVERGLKGEIAEDFISGLKQLFEDHYVDVPDEKYDVLEAQSEKITELEGKLDEAISNIVSLRQEKTSLIKERAISEATGDLADTEIEKFKSLTGDVEFTDESSFKEKLDTLKESYFPRQKSATTENEPVINDEETGSAQDVDVTDSMNSYMRAIGKFGNGAK